MIYLLSRPRYTSRKAAPLSQCPTPSDPSIWMLVRFFIRTIILISAYQAFHSNLTVVSQHSQFYSTIPIQQPITDNMPPRRSKRIIAAAGAEAVAAPAVAPAPKAKKGRGVTSGRVTKAKGKATGKGKAKAAPKSKRKDDKAIVEEWNEFLYSYCQDD